MSRITLLAGGVGGAKFALGLRAHLRAARPDDELTIIVNTGDDLWLTGLRVCPDLDSVMYALAGVNDAERGWGRADESERVSAELTAYGIGWPWFTLGDLDLGTHIARTALLRDGLTLSQATARLSERWDLGARLLPATDDEVPTLVEVAVEDASDADATEFLHFEEWWVRTRAGRPARSFVQQGVATAKPAPGVLEAVETADVVLVAPSNPVVSIGTILGIPGIADAVRRTHAPVVGLSPIIGGAAVRGMADACLRAIGVETSAQAVGEYYGVRTADGLLDGWLVDAVDVASVDCLAEQGYDVIARPLRFTSIEETAAIAADALSLAEARRDLGTPTAPRD